MKRKKEVGDRLMAFKVSLMVPKTLTSDDVRDYILDAVRIMRGSTRPPGAEGPGDPGDPIWDLDKDTVKVARLRPKRRPVR